ncbi:MAG: YceI family protein [Candidatus Moduliflexus flocculans]|nr:YceI family protein [Candidatus Moduliflexus flocculans]
MAFDEASPGQSSVSFTIQAASIDTGTPDRDKHLRSGDFFDVEQYPAITFVSTAIKARGGNEHDVTGDLTMRGDHEADHAAGDLPRHGQGPLGQPEARLRNRDHDQPQGLRADWNAALETGGFLVGDEVKISVSIQAA